MDASTTELKTFDLFLEKKIIDIDNMTPKDWANVVMNFLSYCKPFILAFKEPWFQGSGWGKSHPDDRYLRFYTIDKLLVENQVHSKQYIEWTTMKLPKTFDRKSEALVLKRIRDSHFEGVTKVLAITRDASILICEAEFIEKEKHISYPSIRGEVKITDNNSLEKLFSKEEMTGESILNHMLEYTMSMIQHEQERITNEKIRLFKENVVMNMTVG